MTGWLQQTVGLPKARSLEIGRVLEKNGFDRIEFMVRFHLIDELKLQKGTLSKRTMMEIGIDKSIQHQILSSLDRMRCLIPSIGKLRLEQFLFFLEDFEYTSDWLNALGLMDYLGSFVSQNLTQPKSALSAKLNTRDLKVSLQFTKSK